MCSLHCISNKDCQAAIFNSRTLICKLYEKAMMHEVISSSATELVYLVTVSARNMVSPVSISNVDVLIFYKLIAYNTHVFKFLLFELLVEWIFLGYFYILHFYKVIKRLTFLCGWISDFRLLVKLNLTFFQIVYDTLKHIDLWLRSQSVAKSVFVMINSNIVSHDSTGAFSDYVNLAKKNSYIYTKTASY